MNKNYADGSAWAAFDDNPNNRWQFILSGIIITEVTMVPDTVDNHLKQIKSGFRQVLEEAENSESLLMCKNRSADVQCKRF